MSQRLVAKFFRYLERPDVIFRHPFSRRFSPEIPSSEEKRRLAARLRNLAERTIRDVGFRSDTNSFRRMEILRRCELLREPHAQVAKDLALSTRHFYRELAASRDVFFRHFIENASVESVHVETLDGILVRTTDTIRVLIDLYRFEEAIAAGQRALSAGTDLSIRRELLGMLGLAYAHAGDERGVDAITHDIRVASAAQNDEMSAILLAERARARARFVNGKADQARAILRSFQFLPIAERTPHERHALASMLYDSAEYEELYGEPELANHCIAQANYLYDSLSNIDERLRLQRMLARAHRTLSKGNASAAIHLLDEAKTFADEYRLLNELSDVVQSRGAALALAGKQREGIESSLLALDWFTSRNAREIGWHQIGLAQLFVMAGEYHRAISVFQDAKDTLEPLSGMSAIRALLLAECMIRIGKPRAARELSAAAVSAMRRHGVWSRLGYALIVDAEIALTLDQANSAKEGIYESIGLLERFGTAFAYSRALLASARLTGNRRHAREARLVRGVSL